jgi:predicted GNAT family acetyltransferase
MDSIAIIGIRLGEKVRDKLYSISEFIVIDIGELEKVNVSINFIREHLYIVCDTYPRHELPYYLDTKNEVYTDGKNIYCCDNIDDLYVNENKHKYCEIDLVSVGIVLIDDKVLVNKDDCIAYTSEFRDKFAAVVYKPYTDEIEMCYRTELDNNRYECIKLSDGSTYIRDKYPDDIRYQYIKFSDDSLFAMDNNVISTLYDDGTMIPIYDVAEKVNDIYRLGNVCWIDDDVSADVMIIGDGCKALYIIEYTTKIGTLVIPPSVEFVTQLTFGIIYINKLCISNKLRGSGIADKLKYYAMRDFDDYSMKVEWY